MEEFHTLFIWWEVGIICASFCSTLFNVYTQHTRELCAPSRYENEESFDIVKLCSGARCVLCLINCYFEHAFMRRYTDNWHVIKR